MDKIKEFMDGLKKSTKLTLLSCGSFVVMTVLILVFFIAFPITPSEKIMSNIGRGENIFQQNEDIKAEVTSTAISSTLVSNVTTAALKTTSPKRTSAQTLASVNIVITTGSGFRWNGRIPTGDMPYDDTYTTPIEDQTDPNGDRPYNPNEHDPNGMFTQPTTAPNGWEEPGGNTDPGQQQNPDPNQQQDPDPNQQQNPDPNQQQNPDQGQQTPDPIVPDPPVEGGGGEQTPAEN